MSTLAIITKHHGQNLQTSTQQIIDINLNQAISIWMVNKVVDPIAYLSAKHDHWNHLASVLHQSASNHSNNPAITCQKPTNSQGTTNQHAMQQLQLKHHANSLTKSNHHGPHACCNTPNHEANLRKPKLPVETQHHTIGQLQKPRSRHPASSSYYQLTFNLLATMLWNISQMLAGLQPGNNASVHQAMSQVPDL